MPVLEGQTPACLCGKSHLTPHGMRIFRYHTLWVIVLAIFWGSHVVQGVNIVNLIVDSTSDASFVILKVGVENDNIGSTYDSGLSQHFSILDDQLYSLIPGNQITYASPDDLVANWGGISVRAPPGEVENGWNGSFNSDGSLDLTNNGIPGNYDTWTQTDSNSDYMFFEKPISKDLLELDGIEGYDPNTDASIVLSGEGNTIPDAFTAYEGAGGNVIPYSAEGQYFQVQVPEFSSSALVMGGLAALFAAFRRRLSRSVLPFVA